MSTPTHIPHLKLLLKVGDSMPELIDNNTHTIEIIDVMTEEKLTETLKKLKFRAKIDTFQISTPTKNVKMNKSWQSHPCCKSVKLNENRDVISTIIQPSMYNSTYDNDMYHYSKLLRVMEDIYEDLGIQNSKEVTFKRIDVSIDTDVPFIKLKSIINLLADLYCLHYKVKLNDNIEIRNRATHEFTSYRLTTPSRHRQLYIYDKKCKNANGEVETRLEFRYMSNNLKLKKVLIDLKKVLGSLVDYFEDYENNQINLLQHIYDNNYDYIRGDFTKFIDEFKFQVATKRIFDSMHEYCGLSKSGRNAWLNAYRNPQLMNKSKNPKLPRELIFLNITQTEKLINSLKKSINDFRKS